MSNVLPFPIRSFEIDSFRAELPEYDPMRNERLLCGTCTAYIDNDPYDIDWVYREYTGVTFDHQFTLTDDEEYHLFYAIEDFLRDLEFMGNLDF